MLSEELIRLADEICRRKTETQTVEVKAAHMGCPARLYDTLSSFSNQDSGGIILFGLNENDGFRPVGVYDVNDLQKKVTEQCNQMSPAVRAVFTAAEYEGCSVCSAEIPSIDITERPCFYKGTGRVKGSYVRVGDADLPMSDYEIYAFESFRKHQHDDERPVERADLSMLNADRLQTYLLQMRIDRPGFTQLSAEQAYEMLAITRDSVPTLAAVLNFGIYPQGYFPQLAVTATVIPGKEIGEVSADGARFLDNKRIEGTLPDMLEQTLSFCRRNMKVKTVIDPETAKRRDQAEYPIEAIREAVLNALIHRDYSIYTEGTPIQINFFADRLEIHSPGGLYGRMTVEDLGFARPDLRNPALATMAEFLLKTENRYSGIPTIRREMAAAGLPAPVFQNRRNEFVVILYNHA
ncbi:MAG: putative DNA binding domain-containing protein, partial [Clostridia bacterium]|nr:putative DNA binding domain-containing protein [Clostridia bacterium]